MLAVAIRIGSLYFIETVINLQQLREIGTEKMLLVIIIIEYITDVFKGEIKRQKTIAILQDQEHFIEGITSINFMAINNVISVAKNTMYMN